MTLNRIGLIGDVHAEAVRLEVALAFLRDAGVDIILCVGDVVDGRGDVDRCCELLSASDIAVVRGNHDRWFLEGLMRDLPEATQLKDISEFSMALLKALPKTLNFETVVGRLLLCRGVGENDMQRLTPDDNGYALEVNANCSGSFKSGSFVS